MDEAIKAPVMNISYRGNRCTSPALKCQIWINVNSQGGALQVGGPIMF